MRNYLSQGDKGSTYTNNDVQEPCDWTQVNQNQQTKNKEVSQSSLDPPLAPRYLWLSITSCPSHVPLP